MDDLTREPDPDFARLPDDYGEDDEGVAVYTYEGPSRPARPGTAKHITLLVKYIEARDHLQGKGRVLGARCYEPEEVDAMRLELIQQGTIAVNGENLAGSSGDDVEASKNGF